ncbi:MAG: protein-tyrosine phosphatase [Flavobacteriales bacterium]
MRKKYNTQNMNFLKTTVFLLLACIFFISSCSKNAIPTPAYTLQEDLIVERTKKADYKLYFTKNAAWDISMASSPDQIDWDKPNASFEGDFIQFSKAGRNGRIFFGVTAQEGGERFIVSERIIPMKGTVNFRDIGGLPAGDNRIVRWGKIFRSDKLSDLTKKDLAYMSDLNIKSVCDFRNDIEIKKDPDRLPKGVKYYQFAIADKEGREHARIKELVMSRRLKDLQAKEYFGFIMTAFADTAGVDFKPVVDLLVNEPEDNVPLLYHCSGGKDRTGLMSFVILAALGVEKEVIKNEYLMSNFYRYKTNKKNSRRARLVRINRETSSYAFVVQQEYFDRVYKVIDEKYGGMDNYLKVKFDLDEEKRLLLRERYTMEVPQK